MPSYNDEEVDWTFKYTRDQYAPMTDTSDSPQDHEPESRRRWAGLWRCVKVGCMMLALLFIALNLVVVSEWTYFHRIFTYPAEAPITTVDWYQPKATIASQAVRPLLVADPREVQIDAAVLEQASEHAKEKNSSALLILHRGQIVMERYWKGHDQDRWSTSASMAKAVTALLIGVAIDEGLIESADTPAARFIPAWAVDSRQEITLRHLLQMHSGLRPMGLYEDPSSDACYLAGGTDNRYIVDGCPAVGNPGQVMDYNNTNYQALGVVLEAATGASFQEYLSRKLWAPVGNREAAMWLDREGGTAKTFGFVFATARDWARIGLLFQNGGRVGGSQVVSESWVRFMCSPSPTDPTYGAGVYTGPDGDYGPFTAPDTFVLNGLHKQRVYVIPSHELVIVRIGENAKDWDDALLPNLLVSGITKNPGIPEG